MEKFKAAMFDFDGTVTEKGEHMPPKEMAEALVKLSKVMPFSFCTGRQLESFEKHGLGVLLDAIDHGEREEFLKQMHLVAENGSVGYKYAGNGLFEEFYRVDWPEDFLEKEKFKNDLDGLVKDIGSVYREDDSHKVVVVIRTVYTHTLVTEGGAKIEEVYKLSDEIYQRVVDYLSNLDPGFEKYLHVGNSGIGVVVCPANGDKDTGVRKFANYLVDNFAMKIGEEAREIMLVGDRPQKGGNDQRFLSGRYGSPFTVGDLHIENDHLKAVFNEEGERLVHYKGTIYLIEQLLESN